MRIPVTFGRAPPVGKAFMATLTIIFLYGCGAAQYVTHQREAADMALAFASVPARVCISVNNARPELLVRAGGEIHQRAVREGWSASAEMLAVENLHHRDELLRNLVSPRWVGEGGEVHIGLCSRATIGLERAALLIADFDDMRGEHWLDSVREVVAVLAGVKSIVESLGIDDFQRWLNELSSNDADAAGDLGEHLLLFLDTASRFLPVGDTLIDVMNNAIVQHRRPWEVDT